MADISRMFFLRHLRAEASSHVLLFRGAKLRRSGRGLAFWFSPFAVSIAEVPVDDREVALAVHGRSSDFQDVVVQGSVTFRIANPELTAARVDFSIDPRRGTYLRQPLEKLALMLTQLAQQRAQSYVKDAALRDVVVRGHDGVRTAIEQGLADAPLLTDLGLEVVAVRIESVKPIPEVERALEAPTRERIQEEADEATFRRRAQAVDKERAIQENEMQNQIELAKREQQLIDQRGQNARKEATEKAQAARIESEAQAGRARLASDAQADGIRAVEGARMNLEKERLEAYKTMPASVLAGLAAQELAGKLQRIEHLNITPELLGPLLADLLEAGTKRLGGPDPAAGKAAKDGR
jgi:regulator of protease activity HflC (stomatin/prohibitin superfamily)